ncbi:MAG: cytochrome oxidase assembly protein [Chloroflexi bacterium HGW-Chloroflexi-10]|nr:MAG: cytochrome oxidase assembly protein [Chloroflexi bacterium HGW-Chloroflexi-10]
MHQRKFSKFAFFVLIYNVFVILFGAFVRASGSGAGCGAHWPSCNGTVLPVNAQIETYIEFTHRVTSGITIIFVFLLLLFAFRIFPRNSKIRKAAIAVVGFTLVEALVGAGLVLFHLTADNDSLARAIVIAIHLINTFLLLASNVLVFEWSRLGEPTEISGSKKWLWLYSIVTVALLLLGASGAITALGDTLFPSTSILEGIQQDLSTSVHFLLNLRVYHPIIAVIIAIGLYFFHRFGKREDSTSFYRHYLKLFSIVYVTQLFLGGLNVLLLAPIWMQIVHLFVADLIWILYVFMINHLIFSFDSISLQHSKLSNP